MSHSIGGSWAGLPSPPVQQQVLGRSCCKHLGQPCRTIPIACAALSTADSSPGMFERELQKGGTGREEIQHLPAFTLCLQGQLYQNPARSRAGSCLQYRADERTAKPHPRGLLARAVYHKNTQLQIQTVCKILKSLWFRICGHAFSVISASPRF